MSNVTGKKQKSTKIFNRLRGGHAFACRCGGARYTISQEPLTAAGPPEDDENIRVAAASAGLPMVRPSAIGKARVPWLRLRSDALHYV
jgi:hypothetical protein